MPTLEYCTLDAVNDNDDAKNIVVRLYRTWEARDFKRNNVLLGVECLLLDEKANVIQASIHPRRLHKFRPKLKEGLLFSLSFFDVKKQGETYRLTDHAYKIFFNDQTTMDVVDGEQYKIPVHHFRILPYESIELLADKGANLPDIVAQVSCIRNSGKVDNKVSPPNTSSNLILTCVFASGEKAFISIWDKLACKVRDDLDKLKEIPLVVLATGVNPKIFRGALYLNCTASTKFFWNLENKITHDFRQSSHFQKLLIPAFEDKIMEEVPTDVQTIEQILCFIAAQGGLEKMIWCKAKVVDVILSSGWFMISCTTCFTKMKKNGGTLTCRKCGPIAIGQLRYRIEVIVDDDINTATFVIFNEPGKETLHISATELAAANNVTENDDFGEIVPDVIQKLVGREFFFKIKVTEYNYTATNQSFSVSKMVTLPPRETKKRPLPSSVSTPTKSSISNSATKPNKKNLSASSGSASSGGDGQELKKRPTVRKNTSKVVTDESDEEEPHVLVRANHTLEEDA